MKSEHDESLYYATQSPSDFISNNSVLINYLKTSRQKHGAEDAKT